MVSSSRLLACIHVLVLASLATQANSQASFWHPRNFLRSSLPSRPFGVGDGEMGVKAVAIDLNDPPSGVPKNEEEEVVEEGAGSIEEDEGVDRGVPETSAFTAPKTTPAEEKSCGCLLGVNEYDFHPASDFWTTEALPEPSTLEGALKAASSSNNVVLVMMTNAGEMDLVDNFLCSLRMIGVNKYLIFGTDVGALQMMKERGYHAWDGRSIVGKGLDAKDSNFRSSAWKQLVRAKMKVADIVLRAGFHLFFSDVDVVALENFLPSITADSQKSPQWLMDWDDSSKTKKEANTGFYFMRAEKGSIDLLTKATLQQKKMPAKDDQQLINAVMSPSQRNYMPRPKFANGCYLRRVGKRSDLRQEGVAAVHVNCAVSKLMKHKLMCNMGLWFCANVPEGGFPKGAGGKCRPGYGMDGFRGSNSFAASAVV